MSLSWISPLPYLGVQLASSHKGVADVVLSKVTYSS